jgi:DHA1 family tetracycline resistance protein-like MFS transporter
VAFVIIAANLVGFSVLVSFQTMASMRADEKSQGATLGGLQALSNLMLVAAPVFAAVLLSVMSSSSATSWLAGLPFFFCAALVFLAIVLAGPRLAKLGSDESAGLMRRDRAHSPQPSTSL